MNRKRIKVLITIVTYNNEKEIEKTLVPLLEESTELELCISIVDNNSNDGTIEVINRIMKKYDPWKIKFIANAHNSGWSRGINLAIRNRDFEPDYVLLLNPDAEIEVDGLKAMISFLEEHQEIGVLSPSFVNEDGKKTLGIFPNYTLTDALLGVIGLRRIKSLLLKVMYGKKSEPFVAKGCYPSGAAVLIRWDTLKRIGFLDERYFLYYDDADLGRKLQSAQETLVCMPSVTVNHKGGASANTLAKEATENEIRRLCIALQSEFAYYEKWYGPAVSQFVKWYKLMVDLPLRAFLQMVVNSKSPSVLLEVRRRIKKGISDGETKL